MGGEKSTLTNSRMPDWQHLNADPRSEYASNIEENDSGRDRHQLTRSAILCIERVPTRILPAFLLESWPSVGGSMGLGEYNRAISRSRVGRKAPKRIPARIQQHKRSAGPVSRHVPIRTSHLTTPASA